MGHELVHVSQYAALAGYATSTRTQAVIEMLEFHAYSYQSILGGSSLNSFDNIGSIARTHPDLFSKLSFTNFGWTSNVNYKYPF